MQRRRFLGASAAILTALLCVTDAAAEQPKKLPVIGFLSSTSSEAYASRVAAFQHGLAEAGFVEGQNVVIEYRWAEGNYDRLPAMAAELVDRSPSEHNRGDNDAGGIGRKSGNRDNPNCL